jgi:TRAP transporter TAXI family solute receptor
MSLSRIALLLLPLLIVLVGAFWFVSTLIQPPPQRVVVISTGGEAGAYHAFGKRYQAYLARLGINVQLRTSAGAIENLKRLRDPSSGVSVALMQGGIAGKDEVDGLVSVGRMFYEPLWIFYRGSETLDHLGQLKGKRIAVGPDGSGTRKLATTLLTAANIGDQNAMLLPITGPAAEEALQNGSADAILLAFAPEAPLVQKLLRDPTVKLMSMAQAQALSRIYPFLSRVTLPQGVIDLERNIPASDVDLIAPVAALVAREDLHPALVAKLAEAAADMHSGANLLTAAGEFPRNLDPEFPMSADAVRFYKNGPSFFQRYLPFWLANFVERMLVLIIPLATLLVPLVRGIPALNKWRVQRKLTYWYGRLDKLEGSIGQQPASAAQLQDLSNITSAVASLDVPRAYSEQYYNLRGHIDMVRARLSAQIQRVA